MKTTTSVSVASGGYLPSLSRLGKYPLLATDTEVNLKPRNLLSDGD